MVAKIIERLKLRVADNIAMRKWEKQKRTEGFPAEWFEDNPIDEDYLPTEEDAARVDEIQADLKGELYKDEKNS